MTGRGLSGGRRGGGGEGDGVGMDRDLFDASTIDFRIRCDVAKGSSPPVSSFFSRYFLEPSPSTVSTEERKKNFPT